MSREPQELQLLLQFISLIFFPQPEEKTLKFSFDTRLCGNPAYSFKKPGKMILVVMFIMVRSERSEI